MRFAVAHKAATYLVVLCAYFAMIAGGQLPGMIAIAGLIGLALSWFWEPPLIKFERWQWVWTTGSVFALVYSVLTAVVTGDFLGVGAQFLVWLTVAKAFTRRAARDWQQLYLLAFLMLVAGSVLNADLTYGICFLGFVISATWALTLFHLRREMEDNLLVKHAADRASERVEVRRILDSKRIVGGRFFAGTGALSLAVFLASAAAFLALPRVGFGFFLKGRGGLTLTGFSERVKLGGHGVLKNDDTVVMRVEVDPKIGGRDAPALHWRGIAFDEYSHGEWHVTDRAPPTEDMVSYPRPGVERHTLAWRSSELNSTKALAETAVRQDIWLDPLDSDVMFGASNPRMFDVPEQRRPNKVMRNDELRLQHPNTIHYTVYSQVAMPAVSALKAAPNTLPTARRDYQLYLQVPPEITPRTRGLALQITVGLTNNYDKALAIINWLDANTSYTLELKEPGQQEPIDFFLFDRKQGHCEYYASAFAILARINGIPTRQVNGFFGGEWNEYQGYVAVRAGDAHSWDEVFFPGKGWVTFDPTPPDRTDPLGRGGSGWRARMGRFMDTVRFQWTKWVIEYDLVAQLSLFKDIGTAIKNGAISIRDFVVRMWPIVGGVAAALVLLILVRRRRVAHDPMETSRARARTRSAIARTYDQILRLLAKHGIRREPGTTPKELAARLTTPVGDPLRELTELYYAAEWGGRVTAEAEARADELATVIRVGTRHVAPLTPGPVETPARLASVLVKLKRGSTHVIDGDSDGRITRGLAFAMNHAPMRLLVMGLLIGLSSSTAFADTDGTGSGALPDGTILSFGHLYLHENNVEANTQPLHDPNSLYNYFNLAHCQCSLPGAAVKQPYYEDVFAYLITLNSQSSTITQPLEIWTGVGCDDTIMRPMNCTQIGNGGVTDIATIGIAGTAPNIKIWQLMNPEPLADGAAPACQQRVLAANEWAIADTMASGTPDFFVPQPINTDSLPPPLPTQFTASGGESAIQISWNAPIGNVADIAYYQALCAKADGSPGRTDSNIPAARYATARTLCEAPIDITLTASSPTIQSTSDAGVDAGVDAGPDAALDDGGTPIPNIPVGLKQLDPAFLCGENPTATATSMRLDNLENGVPYTVVVLAIDLYGNAAGTYFTSTLTPEPVTDFWEDLHNKNDHIEGGFCLLAGTYGDDNPLTNQLRAFRDHTLADTAYGRWLIHAYYATLAPLGQFVQNHITLRILSGILLFPLVVLALLWHFLTLPGLLILGGLLALRRRLVKHRVRVAQVATAGAALFVMFGSPAKAHAQSPYWEDQTTGENSDTPSADENQEVKWYAGVKVGPYTPGIDSQSAMKNSAGQGPYQAMFGGYQILPMLNVDRFLWTGFGEFGVGLGVGYMSKTAHAYTMDSDPNSPTRTRSPGDETSFKLIPLQITATYRLTYFDDDYGIPIVPYVRGGVGYYIWWATAPDGSFSTDPTDSHNKALGATAGLVGAIGLSVRAERIDAAAAQSMHESGLEHAGFYGEINAGWVDGFGKSTKLDVGATTWFAGVDFEF